LHQQVEQYHKSTACFKSHLSSTLNQHFIEAPSCIMLKLGPCESSLISQCVVFNESERMTECRNDQVVVAFSQNGHPATLNIMNIY